MYALVLHDPDGFPVKVVGNFDRLCDGAMERALKEKGYSGARKSSPPAVGMSFYNLAGYKIVILDQVSLPDLP
jgi:hypothetical protein